jgi:hypothetical protein
MASAVRSARQKASKYDPDRFPREYVVEFDNALRDIIEKETGTRIPPIPIDWKDAATPMYVNYSKTIRQHDDLYTYGGSREEGEKRREAVSLVPPDGEPCTAIIIARNAIATAEHCSKRLPTTFTTGAVAGQGHVVTIDPSKFQVARASDETPLDLAVLVCETTIPDVPEDNLPIFASSDMIKNAKELFIVGYGGARSDSSAAGDRRLGSVAMSSPDCGDAVVATTYDCKSGFEIVAGARPEVDRVSCPVETPQPDQRGACHGDSGGPVYVRVGNQLFLAGVIRAFHDPLQCGCAAATNLYVRLDTQITFLKSLLNIDFLPAQLAQVGTP